MIAKLFNFSLHHDFKVFFHNHACSYEDYFPTMNKNRTVIIYSFRIR